MLDRILEHKKTEIQTLIQPEDQKLPKRSFYEALKHPNRTVGLIAEVKKASPSKGIIKENFKPEMHAAQYEKGGADCLSVLTDSKFFKGDNAYLSIAKRETNLPVLRKDFIVDHLQVEESDYLGADAILLIGEALDPVYLSELYHHAIERGMDALVEVHSLPVLERILKQITPELIGINNRDLTTFHTDIRRAAEFKGYIPKDSLLVSESGIHTSQDLTLVKEYGAQAVLVGESLMKHQSQEEAVLNLFGEYA
ncbi:indole-3-glycerol phosphate synthase TrpC [Bacillus sp. FJAT-42376]|uniref:indole-3-glycerol phosphate synthase TrpC n=1 Tax=Bacillus sp. FJAT-42376 TaxID=2014076 RepID=UPI000F505D10|nr:indole-3-glycerol phosphate synthase TrpC [Bacillus sp. FJAT-42376]AZB43331.1 indole-3-glycerol phosphate synthase TrpC [Bacillus sp. FJAT-42376]